MKAIFIKLYRYRFELLLFSIVLVFLINIFYPEDIYGGIGQLIYVIVQLFAGINLFRNKRKMVFKILLFLTCSIIIGRILGVLEVIELTRYFSLFYVIFFGTVILELFRQLGRTEVVNKKIVIAAICGLLLIGYTGYFIFTAIEFFMPGSFTGLSEGPAKFRDLFYYSYVTLMTIGYGDISPATWVAKNATLVCALIGYIYSIVVVAVIVGRFSSNQPKK